MRIKDGKILLNPMLSMDSKINEEYTFLNQEIMIAEDEEINFLYLKTLLTRAGAIVYHARNGSQVIDLLKMHPEITIILMDIRMPVMDGFAATRAVKEINPHVVIIAQTAYTLLDDKCKCFEAGCDDYLTKPIEKNMLYSVLEKYIVNRN